MESLETKTQLITLAQAAKRTGYTPEYLNSLSRQGILLAQKIGRNWFVAEQHLQSFEAWIHSASYPKPGRKKSHAENPVNFSESNSDSEFDSDTLKLAEPTAAEEPIEITPKFKLPIFKERMMRFAFTFLLFWGASVGLAYLLAHGQTKIVTEKKSAVSLPTGAASFAENYQEKVGEVLAALDIPRNDFSLELNQQYFPDNSQVSEIFSANNSPQSAEPKIAGAEKSVAPQAEIKVSPLSKDAWKYIFLIGGALLSALLIFWFLFSIHRVFLQPVGTFGWIILLIFFLASSLTLNQFIRQTVEPGINETQFNPFKPSTAGQPSPAGKPNSKNGVQISGGKQTQEAFITASEFDARLLDYVLKDSLKKNQTLAPIPLEFRNQDFEWKNQEINLAKDSIDSREIARHAIEAEDIDTGSITSRTIRNHTIQGEDIDPNTDVTLNALNVATFIDLGTNTIADGNFVGDWNFNGGDLTTTGNITTGTLAAGATILGGNLDMANNIIQNIGDAGTDFTATGGLNLAGDLDVNGLVNDIAGTLNLSGNALTASGLLTITPALGLTINTPGQTVTLETQNFDVNATGAVTIDGTNFTYTLTGTYTVTLADNLANALDIQEGAHNYININTGNGTENISFGNATTNPTYSFLGTGAVTINGNAENTTALGVTAGDLVLTDGDLTLSSGDFSFTGATGLISLSSTLGITALGTTLDATTLSIDSTDTTNLTMTANAAGDKTLTIAATNSGAGAGLINMSADGDININTSSGTFYLNNTNNQPINTGIGLMTADGSLTVNGSTILGDSAADLVTFNAVVGSDIIPVDNTRNLGSGGARWDIGYFDEVNATNIAGVVITGSTSSASWTINSDNATNDLEISSLVFERGNPVINAVIQWNAAGDGGHQNGYDNTILSNFPISIFSQTSGINHTFTSGNIFNFSQGVINPFTQTGALTGLNLDLLSNITVDNSVNSNQTGILATLQNGGAAATAIGFQTAGTLDYGLDLGGTIGTADIRLSNGETISNLVDGTILLTAATTSTGLITGNTGLTVTGAAISLNNSSNFATNINTGNSTGAVAIGGNSNTVAIDTSDWNIDTTGAITNATYEGLTITTTTGTFTLTNGKTLTVSDSATLATNSITLAGGEVITFSPTNALSLLTTGATIVTLPTTGTLISTDQTAAQTIGNTTNRLAKLWATDIATTDLTVTNPIIGHSSLDLPLAGGTLTGNLLFSLDNTLDIGASAATRPRTGYFGTSVIAPTINATTALQINGATVLSGTTLGSTIVSSSLTSVGTLAGLTITAAPTFSAMTLGSVLFAGTAGVVSQDNANFFWDDANNRLGIGTTSPTYKLDIVNANKNQLRIVSSDDAPGLNFTTLNADAGARNWGIYADHTVWGDFAIRQSNAKDGDPSAAGGTARFYIKNDGNVGIGTTSPASKLDVWGDARLSGTYPNLIMKPAAWTTYGYMQMGVDPDGQVAGDYMFSNVPTGKGFSWAINNSSKMVMNTSGNVGIGTTGPATNLDLTASGAGGMVINQRADAATFSGLLYFKGSTQTYAIRNENGYLAFDYGATVNTTGGTAGMVMNTSGNVGIGTTNPGVALHVVGSMYTQSTNGYLIYGNGARILTTGNGIESQAAAGGLEMGTSNALPIVFYTGATEKMRILSGGNVGIGTTGPNLLARANDKVVTISGGTTYGGVLELHRGNSSASTYLGLVSFLGDASTEFARIEADRGAGTDGGLAFYTKVNGGAVAQNMTILGSGNVGIGTTTPTALTHILQTGAGDAFRVDDVLADTSPFVIKADGNVGIGTTAPGMALDVNGSIRGNYMYLNPADGDLDWGNGTGPRPLIRGNLANNTLKFYTSSLSRILIDSAGNVGIGTASPVSLLDVSSTTGVAAINLSTHLTASTQSIFFVGNTGSGENDGYLKLSDNGTIKVLIAANNSRGGDTYFNGGGNVGIGTTGPVSQTEISGTSPYLTLSNSLIDVPADTSLGILNFYSRDTSALSSGGIASIRAYSAAAYNNSATPSYLSFYTHGATNNDGTVLGTQTEQMRITSTGNVGIGTTGPTFPFQVQGAGINSTAHFGATGTGATSYGITSEVTGAGTLNKGIRIYSSGAAANQGLYIGASAPAAGVNNYAIYSESQAQSYFAGNVGIGTTAPTGELNVVSVSTTNILRGISSYQYSDGAHSAVIGMVKARGTATAPTTVADGDYVGRLQFVGYGTAYTNRAGIDAQVNGTVAANSVPTDLIFNTGSTIISEKMRILSGGNVGIGTTNPGSKLHIAGGNLILGPVSASAGATGAIQFRELAVKGTESIGFKAPDDVGDSSFIFTLPASYGNANDVLQTSGATGILSWAANAAAGGMSNPMTVTGDLVYASDTVTPATPAKLAIGSNGQCLVVTLGLPAWGSCPTEAGLVPAGNTTEVQFNNAGAFGANSDFTWDNTATVKTLSLTGTVDAPKISLSLLNSSTGNTATNELHIGNDAMVDALDLWINSSANSTGFNTASIFNRTIAASAGGAGVLTFGTANTERMRIDSAGNVGIGTTVASALLDIGTGTPIAAASGLMFGADAAANLYRISAGTIKTDGALVVVGSITGAGGAYTTLTSSGATTLGTGAALTNTFGAGASSINTIGSATTPGILTLLGSTIVAGSANTTAITLGNITTNPTLTLLGTGLTSLGGSLTVTGTAWTATPTISGLITATSGLTSTGAFIANGTSTFNNTITQTGANTFSTGTGAVSLNGATTLISTFSQTGANTFSTGTGAVSLNGATSITGTNTFNVGTGLTTLGGNLTVTGTAWTATPTISGLITATSGLTATGLLTASNGLTLTAGALNLTATSGALTLSGLSISSISTGANTLTITSSNFNTTATGINSTAIGATTASTGAFTTLTTSNGYLTTPTNTATSVVTIDGTQTLTNKTLTSPNMNEAVALTTTSTKLNYLTSAGGTTGTATTNIVFSTSPTIVTPTIASLIGNKIYPASDSATAIQINKANGTTTVLNVDTVSGLIGIGTTAPDATLKVVGSICASATDVACFGTTAGNIYAANFIVNVGTHLPDYVFENDYPLLPIADLKNYLALNKHLPGVPGAAEVSQNGLNLGQMVPILLEKTEENTLYAIDNYKNIQSQQLQINGISDQINALGAGFYITDSRGQAIFSGTREISAQPSREMVLTASSIILDGNVNIASGTLTVDGINILEKTNENSQYIVGLVQNQNLIANQLTEQLLDENLSVNSKIQLIGERLNDLATEPIATLNEKIASIDSQLLALNTLQTQVDGIKGEYDDIMGFLSVIDGNFNLMDGTLESAGVVAGAFTVKTVEGKPQTIGEAFICPASLDVNPVDGDGIDDRKNEANNEAETFCYAALGHNGDLSSKVDTGVVKSNGETAHAITATAKIFINFENNPGAVSWTEREVIKTAGQPDVYTGKFTIKLNQPVASPVKVNWWIVESE